MVDGDMNNKWPDL